MPPRKRGASTKSTDDNGSPQSSKRVKTSPSSTAAPSGKKLVDGDGNPYWELSARLRHVTVSYFKGNYLISIREHYEKDGKILPGKKGISLTVDQFNNLLSVLPQIDRYLADNDIPLTRPIYGMLNAGDKGKSDEDEEEDEKKEEEDEKKEEEDEKKEEEDEKKEEKAKEGEKKRGSTKEAEHDEEEEEEEETEEEEEEEVKPKKKPVQKKTGPKQKKAKAISARKRAI